jgi:hypothetical protein
MLLYHFTTPDRLASIARQGLVPGEGKPGDLLAGKRGVWLTENPVKTVSATDRALLVAQGVWDDAGWLPLANEMLTVRIPECARLKHYLTWLRKQTPSIDSSVAVILEAGRRTSRGTRLLPNLNNPLLRPVGMAAQWWVYFGTIKPDRIVADLP